jgi:ferritin-like protein
MFPASDFTALGLSNDDVTNLKAVAVTESTHVIQLSAAISAAGGTPVQPCTYNFGFTNAQNMVATARVLEAVGISA